MRAPDAVVANRRSAVRHWRNEPNIRLRDVVVNIVVSLIRSPTIASVADRCRAQASSMPEGPATGRVEAKRRALTMPSTAPASSARWWCGSIWRRTGPVLQENGARARTDSCGKHRHASAAHLGTNVHAGGAVLLHELGSQTATRDTTNDGVNDPVRALWGQVQGTTAGSFTPSLVQ